MNKMNEKKQFEKENTKREKTVENKNGENIGNIKIEQSQDKATIPIKIDDKDKGKKKDTDKKQNNIDQSVKKANKKIINNSKKTNI